MEDKDKLDKAIEHAIRQVGKERDAEDLATLKSFMAKQEGQNEYRVCYYAPEKDEKSVLKPRKPISKEERQRIKEERQKELEEQRNKTPKKYLYNYVKWLQHNNLKDERPKINDVYWEALHDNPETNPILDCCRSINPKWEEHMKYQEKSTQGQPTTTNTSDIKSKLQQLKSMYEEDFEAYAAGAVCCPVGCRYCFGYHGLHDLVFRRVQRVYRW